jgi:hypothetical protein
MENFWMEVLPVIDLSGKVKNFASLFFRSDCHGSSSVSDSHSFVQDVYSESSAKSDLKQDDKKYRDINFYFRHNSYRFCNLR